MRKVKNDEKTAYIIGDDHLDFPSSANDEEIVQFLDFFENMELVEDENFDEIVDDQMEYETLDGKPEPKTEEEENV